MLKSGRNIALDGEMAENYAKIRPESRLTRETAKIMLKFGRNLALDGETAVNFTKIGHPALLPLPADFSRFTAEIEFCSSGDSAIQFKIITRLM